MMALKCRFCRYREECQPQLEEAHQHNKQQESIRRKLTRAQRIRKLNEYLKNLMRLEDDN